MIFLKNFIVFVEILAALQWGRYFRRVQLSIVKYGINVGNSNL